MNTNRASCLKTGTSHPPGGWVSGDPTSPGGGSLIFVASLSRTRLHLSLAAGVLAAIGVTGCAPPPDAAGGSAEIEYLQMPGMEDPGLPFSAAVRVDETLYVSGNVGNLPGTLELAPGGIGPETRQTLDNIKAVVEQFGSSMDRVVKCTVFLADIAEWGAMNEVYRTYFENPPARSALGASGLALGARVEIECIAVVDQIP